MSQGMKKEVQQIKDRSVVTEIDGDTMTPEQRANIIESRWVQNNEARARIVAKGYTGPVADHDLLSASTRLFCILRVLHNGIGVELVSLRRRCECCISTCSSNLIQLGNETAAHLQ